MRVTPENLPKTLRALRGKRTLKDVSIATGLSEYAIRRIEQGEKSPTIEELQSLSGAYRRHFGIEISGYKNDF